jgi:hypothetical protein
MLEDRPAPEEPPDVVKRVATVLGGCLATALLAGLAMSLGSWGFRFRSASLHEGRLARLVEQKPPIDLVVAALTQEGGMPIAAAAGERELRHLAAEHGGIQAGEVWHKGQRHAQTRAFRVGDALYVLYFDADGVLRDFTCIAR